ncbi:MAG: FliH/SctL family protein [Pseudomonadota bacterium]
MGAPAKFLFDTDFAAPASAKERAATSAEIAQQVADAEVRGYREGFEAAQREARIESDRRSALALEEIGIGINGIAGRFSGIEGRMETEAIEVAMAVARKLCSELMAAEPLTEIVALVQDCFRHLTSTPHIVVRINDDLYDTARQSIEQLAKRSGFEGRLVILAEPQISGGDCKIEWADGGVTLDRTSIDSKIDELVGRYLATRNQADIQAAVRTDHE